SLGGPIMLEAASLINARVLGMIGVDTLHNFDPKPMNNEKIDNYLQAYFDNPVKAEEMFHDTSRSDLIKFVDRSREKTGAGIISAAFREMLVYLQSMKKQFSSPLVLINSSSWMPTNLDAAHKYGVKVELMKGVGHFIMLENPDGLNQFIEKNIDQITLNSS